MMLRVGRECISPKHEMIIYDVITQVTWLSNFVDQKLQHTLNVFTPVGILVKITKIAKKTTKHWSAKFDQT